MVDHFSEGKGGQQRRPQSTKLLKTVATCLQSSSRITTCKRSKPIEDPNKKVSIDIDYSPSSSTLINYGATMDSDETSKPSTLGNEMIVVRMENILVWDI